jgi:transcription-repair coupling factor (superfamily II helicase)
LDKIAQIFKVGKLQARIYEYLQQSFNHNLYITKDEKEAALVAEVTAFLGYPTFKLPDFRANFGDDLRPYKEELFELFSTLSAFYKNPKKKKLLIAPFRTILTPLPKPALFDTIMIEFAQRVDLTALKERLHNWGYSFVDIVEEEGEVSFRGDIIDIYPRGEKNPFRVSLFDDEVEEIRTFTCESQKSQKEEIASFEIAPAYFAFDSKEVAKVEACIEEIESDSFMKDIASLGLWCLGEMAEDLVESLPTIMISDFRQDIQEVFSFIENDAKKEQLLSLEVLPKETEYKDIEIADVGAFIDFHKGKKIKILANNEAIIKQYDLPKEVAYQFVESPHIVNVMSEKEIILSLNKAQKKKRRRRSNIVLDELSVGDYVVHENYGIGIFKGLKNTTVLGAVKDFVEIAYQNDDKVLVPVENIEVIDRYIADGGSLAVVDRLGKGSFLKLKEKTRAKLFEIAKDIIKIAAERELTNAPVIESDFLELTLFQNDAGFVYTEDQEKSIHEIFADLKSGKVMDRLLSGDVGFGKTEVAMNAIFATVKSGFGAALIAPTTLLVSQHYKGIKMRLEKYGIKVAKLDRFTTTKEKTAILAGLKAGSIDLCIGTHALLGVEFKDLGLLIIDEEHKFGVKQKERLKNLRADMHILSMSATPIPRSLNMALSSIKQYSQLLTAPSEREDVRTFVKAYEPKLLKEVILREKRRSGQIFYVHNRIASIENKKKEILEILPELKILVLHSKIPPATTEKEVMAFESGEYDLLLSTSIVESGIHMPNVNTIMIESADNFGIADLHQLRGRVGRGKRQGYCYYLVEDRDKLTEDAQKRLLALESNSFLGSGSVLAYHDLEIRGGGNLVGEAQSGHIKGIGYSLYLKMLEDAINLLLNQNQDVESKKEVEIKLAISAYLSSEVVGEDRIRLEIYRRLSKCTSAKDVYKIEEELIDRFGKLDVATKQFIELIVIKILALEKGLKGISNYAENITIMIDEDNKEYLKARSKDDDDVIEAVLGYLRKK